MIMRSEGKFSQFVISAAKRIDFRKVKQILGTKSVSLATAEEVEMVTGCKIGSVPPYGNLFNIPVYVDKSLLENEIIDFNAGRHDTSIQMKCKDYIDIVKPVISDFSED